MRFNGTSKSYVTVLRGRVRPFFAPLERNLRFDSNLIKTDRGHRVIEVPILISYNKMSEFRLLTEDIAGWLVSDSPKALEFEDEPDRFYYAVVDDTITEEFLYNQGTEATLKFICGYKYSLDRSINITDSVTRVIEGHKSTNWTSQTIFTSNQSSYTLEFSNAGKTSLRDINKIKLNYNFVKGDSLTIDYSKRLVILNGNDITNALSILQSNFMTLPIGQVQFSTSHPSKLIYNERYY